MYGGDAVLPSGYAVGMTREQRQRKLVETKDTKSAPRTQSHLPEGQVKERSATEDYNVNESRGMEK